MKQINIFCFGFGQVAKNFIKKINSENYNINLSITSRDKTQKKEIDNIKYNSFLFDENNIDQSLIHELKKSDHILISIAPVNGNDIVLKNFKDIILSNNPKWVTYLSATSVYGDHKGAWVDEKSRTSPTSQNGVDRLEAENSWLDLANNNKLKFKSSNNTYITGGSTFNFSDSVNPSLSYIALSIYLGDYLNEKLNEGC